MHWRHKTQAVLHATATDDLLDLIGDMHHLAPFLCFEDQVFRVALHSTLHYFRIIRASTAQPLS
jgi:hypothetical protein